MSAKPRSAFWVPDDGIGIFHYLETHSPNQRLIALGCHDKMILEQRIERSRDGPFEILPIIFGGKVFHLAINGFERLSGEEQKRSKNSGARYLARRDLGDRGFLVQMVDPWSETSPHGHSRKTEKFEPILGCPNLRLGTPAFKDGERVIELRGACFVSEGVWHQLITEDAPALTMIEVIGSNALGMEDYLRE